eukprot:12936135-Prorocentrum_lima.AAC.1
MGACLWTLWLDVGMEIVNFLTHDSPAGSSPLPGASEGTLFQVFTPHQLPHTMTLGCSVQTKRNLVPGPSVRGSKQRCPDEINCKMPTCDVHRRSQCSKCSLLNY